MIKLLVTDVDGTLVAESKNDINPAYFQIIPQLKAKGIQVVAASGRPFSSMQALFAPVEEHMWFISDCGVTVKTTGEPKAISTMPEDLVRELWDDFSKISGGDAMICGAGEIFIPNEGTAMCKIVRDDYRMKTTCQNGWADFPTIPTGKVSFFALENVEELAKKYIYPKWKDRLHLVISGEWWLDCMLPNVNKATALQGIMDKFGYTADQVMASGDNMNDFEMLQLAGTSLAVGCARPEIKAIAHRVIGTYETDAVLEEWKKLL